MLSESKAITLGAVLANVLEFEEQEIARNLFDFQELSLGPIKSLDPVSGGMPSEEYGQGQTATRSFDEDDDLIIDIDALILESRARRGVSWPKYLSKQNARDLNQKLKQLLALGERSSNSIHETLMHESALLETTLLIAETFSGDNDAGSRWHKQAKEALAIAYDGIEITKRDGISYYYRKP